MPAEDSSNGNHEGRSPPSKIQRIDGIQIDLDGHSNEQANIPMTENEGNQPLESENENDVFLENENHISSPLTN